MNKRILVFFLAVMCLLGGLSAVGVKAQELSVNGGVTTYRVVSGDSLWRVANRFHTTVANIRNLNNLRSDVIYVGQQLRVPSMANVSTLHYTVHQGDTLWGIAHRLGVTADGLVAANGLKTNNIYVGQMLKINFRNPVTTVNYRVSSGETLWDITQKYKTSSNAIIRSNYMQVDYLMPRQILTVPLNSTQFVRPVGISMVRKKANMRFGDIYTWDNGRRLFTVGTRAQIRDLGTGLVFNVRYYGGSNHSDIEPLTRTDTDTMYRAFGRRWAWTNKRPVVVSFTQGGIRYQIAASLIGMPHGDDRNHITNNGMAGHCCLYFYNAVGHSNPTVDAVSQQNVLRANGQ
jgi:LysM repeat protein